MVLAGLSISAVIDEGSRPCPLRDLAEVGHGANGVGQAVVVGPKVVVLRGEHDRSTAADLVVLLADAIDDSDLVIDLDEVTFMDASTLGVLVGIRATLGTRNRGLALRSPSRAVWRVLDICGLSDLVQISSDARPAPLRAAS